MFEAKDAGLMDYSYVTVVTFLGKSLLNAVEMRFY